MLVCYIYIFNNANGQETQQWMPVKTVGNGNTYDNHKSLFIYNNRYICIIDFPTMTVAGCIVDGFHQSMGVHM